MKTAKRVKKFLLSLEQTSEKPMSESSLKAMERDPELKRHVETEEALTKALRNPGTDPVEVPNFLETRILAHVEQEGVSAQGTWWYSVTHGWQLPVIASVLAFAVILFVQQNQPTTMQEDSVPVLDQITEEPGAPITLESPIENHPLVQLSAIIESPLRDEPQRLLNDAENALRVLSRGFLPSSEWREQVKEQYFGSEFEG